MHVKTAINCTLSSTLTPLFIGKYSSTLRTFHGLLMPIVTEVSGQVFFFFFIVDLLYYPSDYYEMRISYSVTIFI